MHALQPRDYQKAILETAKEANTLVVLPTGIGKTLIALLLSIHRLEQHRPSKALILAPTKPLVEQHHVTFTKNLSPLFGELTLFTGEVPASQRKKLWEQSDIIFSTPQCIANDVQKMLYNLHDVSLVVFDEAHRCLKNYDYTKVVTVYKNQAKNQRILGLTASPGSDYQTVKQICDNLEIQDIEVRSRESEDVKPYVQELEFEKKKIEFPKELIEIRTLLRILFNNYVSELKSRNLLHGAPNKISLLKLQANLARQASQGNGAAMYGMSLTAQSIKVAHAIELLETQTLSGLSKYLKELVKQAEEKKSKGVQRLVKAPEFHAVLTALSIALNEKKEHPKIEAMHDLVKNELELNPKAKLLIFTQFRETANRIVEKISSLENVHAAVFIGQAKKETGGMSQKEQKEVLTKFREGEINILCATSIGEEGLDIPEVNMVVFYEPIPSAIRKIQRAGRTARHSSGKLVMLVTDDTKDETNDFIASAREKKMYKIIETLKEDLKRKSRTLREFM